MGPIELPMGINDRFIIMKGLNQELGQLKHSHTHLILHGVQYFLSLLPAKLRPCPTLHTTAVLTSLSAFKDETSIGGCRILNVQGILTYPISAGKLYDLRRNSTWYKTIKIIFQHPPDTP